MYIPVLRYRLAERGAFKTLSKKNIFSSEKIVPLIEIVQHYPTGRIPSVQKSFEQVYTEEFEGNEFPIIIDIPLYVDLRVKNLEEKYKRFLEPNKLDIEVRLNYLLKLSKVKGIIPVVSYDPNIKYANDTLIFQESYLRKNFAHGKLCFRIFTNARLEILTELKCLTGPEDIVLLDLQNEDYRDDKLFNLYEQLKSLRAQNKCKIGLIYAPISGSFSSSMITEGTVISKLDNSLVKNYKELNFDAFADFAGVKKDTLVESYRGQITNIFYCSRNNSYIGFTAKPSMDPKDYAIKIAPAITKSLFWNSFTPKHHECCPGCIEIMNKVNNILHPGNRSTWKSINIEHYIYSINEIL